MQKALIFGLILAVVIVIFALQNSQAIVVKLWFWEFESSLALIMVIVLLLGGVMGVCFSLPAVFRRNRKIEARKKQDHEKSTDNEF